MVRKSEKEINALIKKRKNSGLPVKSRCRQGSSIRRLLDLGHWDRWMTVAARLFPNYSTLVVCRCLEMDHLISRKCG